LVAAGRKPKRYVLLLSEDELTDADRKGLATALEAKYGRVKVIPVEGNPRAVIVKTTNTAAPLLREAGAEPAGGGPPLRTVLTSGSIGKLKSRASGGV
jgi:hypothetical protein